MVPFTELNKEVNFFSINYEMNVSEKSVTLVLCKLFIYYYFCRDYCFPTL